MGNNIAVVVLTFNAGELWQSWVDAYSVQTIRPACYNIDSSSVDSTVDVSRQAGFIVSVIESSTFNHGGTRNSALELCADYEFIVYMTQDAILADSDSIEQILMPFVDEGVAAVCGRQLPRLGAGALESHARLFNYSSESRISSVEDVPNIGLRAAFLSNSFTAYRVSSLKDVNGFPNDVIFGEDMYVASKLLMAGYKISYAADACVYHSHGYSVMEEMRRYFDMGFFHASEPWIRKELGAAEGEGVKFVFSELSYLLKNSWWRIPEGVFRTLVRYLGFRMGLVGHALPLWLKRFMAMNKSYFS